MCQGASDGFKLVEPLQAALFTLRKTQKSVLQSQWNSSKQNAILRLGKTTTYAFLKVKFLSPNFSEIRA